MSLFSQTSDWAAPASDPRWTEWRRMGWDYLRGALGERLPSEIRPLGLFDEHPLEGEGPVGLFAFDLPLGDPVLRRVPRADPVHYLIVGQTEPNYFPTYGLSPEQGYSLHIGTRFMLVVGIALVDLHEEPPAARRALEAIILGCGPGRSIESLEAAAVFRAHEQRFVVYRLGIGGEDFYAMGGDCPPGFYRLTDRPPAVVLRLHLGQLIRAEARSEDAGRRRAERIGGSGGVC